MPRPFRPRALGAVALAAALAPSLPALAQPPAPAPASAPAPPEYDDVPRLPSGASPAQGAEAAEVTERLTFGQAVARALAHNPTALQAQDEIRRYHALMEQVRAASLPTLAGVGTYTRLDSNRDAATGQISIPVGLLSLDLTLAVPLVHPRSWVQWGQAGDQIDVARASAQDVRRTIAVATARAYLAIITQKRLLETARIARDNAKAHFEFTRAQRIGGIGNRLDEVRAAQELTADEVNLQNQKIGLVRAREALGVLVAADGAVDDADESTPTEMPAYGDAMASAGAARADVRARRTAAAAASRTVRDAWADYMPYLDLIASPFYQKPSTDLPLYPPRGWEAQLVLTIPLYDGGLRYGQEHEREARAGEARLDVEATLRQARSDVRTAFEEIKEADAALDQAAQSSAFAKKALDLANLAYRAGATTNLEVIDAERQARDAETQAAIAEDAARQARLDLLAASGRFP